MISGIIDIFLWWILVTVISIAAWPLARRLFQSYPDKGYILSKGLGLAMVVIAGILLVSAAFGSAGVVWAVGYAKKQNNVSRMIELAADGKIPADVLQKAIEEEQSSIFGKLGLGAIAPAVIIAALIFVAPKVFKGNA